MSAPQKPRVLFLGTTYAGWKTRQVNLERNVERDGRLEADFRRITGWQEGGRIERLPLPAGLRGRVRALGESRSLLRIPRPDVIWTSAAEMVAPFFPAFIGPMRRPLVLETDWSLEQQEAMAPWYFDRPPRTGLRLELARKAEQFLVNRATLLTAMSHWAAEGMVRAGADPARVRVIPPGLDLAGWRPQPAPEAAERPLRLLFVGGDFRRKGGDLLLDALRGPLAGRCELEVVTRDPVEPGAGVVVTRAEPNSPELKAAYARADLFVLPTRADCFGHVTVEAMASGRPAIVSDVGGARDIVDQGETGWLIAPGDGAALVAVLERALSQREQLPAMGRRARAVAEERFDGPRNDRLLVDLLLEIAEQGLDWSPGGWR